MTAAVEPRVSITRVQVCGAISNQVSFGAGVLGEVSISSTFPLNLTAGNTVIVAVGSYYSGAGGNTSTPSVEDSLGNTYTQAVWINGAHLTGDAGGFFMAVNVLGGACNITFRVHGAAFAGCAFNADMVAAEYSGMGASPVVQATNQLLTFGTAGNSPETLDFTDQSSVHVVLTYSGGYGSGGPGTISCITLMNLNIGSVSYVLSTYRGNGSPGNVHVPTASGSYQIFAEAIHAVSPDLGDAIYLWDAGSPVPVPPPLIKRGDIGWSQIRLGTDGTYGKGRFGQSTDGSGLAGHVPKWGGPDGITLTDSGILATDLPGGGGAVGAIQLALTVNGPATVEVNSAAVSYDDTILCNGTNDVVYT